MFTITRRQAQRIRSIMRRAFGTMRGPGPVLSFIADAEGLSVKAIYGDVAVEFHDPAVQQPANLWLPFVFLSECEGKRDDTIELEAAAEGKVVARWLDGNVPKTVDYTATSQAHVEVFPTRPTTMTENTPALLAALADAADTTDTASARYALSCIQAQGATGTLAASDGRQMLLQSGFQFPWQGDILIPGNRVFHLAELPHDQPVSIGAGEKWATIGCGPWTIHLRINRDGRFPDLSRHIPRPETATARCRLTAADAAFLGQTLPRLPMDETDNDPVTLELNGSVAIRAKAPGQRATEAELSNATWTGLPLRLAMNRRYLARAAKLGFEELFFFGTSAPMLCQDGRRSYILAVLSPDGAVPASEDAIRIVSPRCGDERSIPVSAIPRRVKSVSETEMSATSVEPVTVTPPVPENRRPQGESRGKAKAGHQDLVALIEQSEKLRTALHDLMYQASGLVKALKQHRRQSKAIQNTIAQIRTLKTLGV